MNALPGRVSCIRHVVLLTAVLLVSGCQSVGTQYHFPREGEKAATLQTMDGQYINNLNEDGCYVGRTAVQGAVRVRPGEPVVLTFEQEFVNLLPVLTDDKKYCRNLLKFTPEEGATYRVSSEVSNPMIGHLTNDLIPPPVCRTSVQQVLPDGTVKPVVVTSLRLFPVNWHCIKIQSIEERQAEIKAEEEADAREEAQEAAEEQAKAAAKAKAAAAKTSPATP
ncbi:hypothetical protein THUN1379_24280 [Paludibacterium sp. THUN1379]|uniref:hypothetical protein n=1 Tax=Paludibacterium sp. THUN1379 TaxID=3112107 RepID=UPI003091196A|nr:hypothetical protein THUN1379_24280 [Paludibacterium sp. THUN1379]